MNEKEIEKYFPMGFGNGTAKKKVFCFHHAGGSALIFRNWKMLNPSFELIPVEMPGRGVRLGEKMQEGLEEMADGAAEAIASVCGKDPFCIYGHSIGCIVAFKVIDRLERLYNRSPDKFVAAGWRSPLDEPPSGFEFNQDVDDEEKFFRILLDLGMITDDLLRDKTFIKFFLPVVKADCLIDNQFRYRNEILKSPILSINGDQDPIAPLSKMIRWKDVTSADHRHYQITGGHFFPYEDQSKEVLKILESEF